MLEELWTNAPSVSAVTMESILSLPNKPAIYLSEPKVYTPPYARMSFQVQEIQQGAITEKDLTKKILNAKKVTAKNPTKTSTPFAVAMRGLQCIHLRTFICLTC